MKLPIMVPAKAVKGDQIVPEPAQVRVWGWKRSS